MSIWVHKQKKHHLHTHTHTHHNKWYSEGARKQGRKAHTHKSLFFASTRQPSFFWQTFLVMLLTYYS
jgi:hypothetical protein